MAKSVQYRMICPQCNQDDRTHRKGRHKLDGEFRFFCKRCNISFIRSIPNIGNDESASQDDRPKINQGAAHPKAKLSEVQVLEILSLRRSGMSAAEVADRFEIAVSSVRAIVSGHTWSALTGILPPRPKISKPIVGKPRR